MSYEFSVPWEEAAEGGDVVFAMLGVWLLVMGVALVIGLVMYVLQSVALYRMSRSCGLSHPWLAWLPIGNMYIIGALAQHDNRTYGKKGMPYAALLPIGTVVMSVLLGMLYGLFAALILVNVAESSGSPALDAAAGAANAAGAGVSVLGMLLAFLLLMVVSIAMVVFEYMALYRIFHLFDQKNATLYILLSIFVSVSLPIILFILRNRQPGAPVAQPPAWTPPNFYQPVQPPAAAPYAAPAQPPVPPPSPETPAE